MAVMKRAVKSRASITWQATRASGFISVLCPAGEQTFSASARAPRAAAHYRPCQGDQGVIRGGLVPMPADSVSFWVRNTKYSSSHGTKVAIFLFMGTLWEQFPPQLQMQCTMIKNLLLFLGFTSLLKFSGVFFST